MKIRLKDLAKILDGELVGTDELIYGVASYKDAAPGQITWAEEEKKILQAEKSKASAVIVPITANFNLKPLIKVIHPKISFAKTLKIFAPQLNLNGVHATCIKGEKVELGKNIYLGPYVILGNRVKIKDRVKILGQVYIGDDCIIDKDTLIYPQVTILDRVKIGSKVIIHSGVVIGSDGFGFIKEGEKHLKIPQIGNVEIQDEVELGANVCIDRATCGTTMVKKGTKIDNLVHIAHNVEIGENCIIIALSGLGGSAIVGDRVILAGQVGISPHIKIGNDSTIMGKAGVTKEIPPKSIVSGFPARSHNKHFKIEACLNNLPELIKQFREFQKKINSIEEKINFKNVSKNN
ncbi:MAG: UDP-3-O-(3-hydroxymyristoyl)glucosamine N-acyltransferase [Armatimonadetes bacterium]|nr:UDP-3-O-(3-hydroxymyristoyl)glucosamine N-acyltransferase [Armatimonadota bacterium]